MLNLITNWCWLLSVGLSLVLSLSMVLYLTAIRKRQNICLPPGSNDSTIRILFQLLKGKGIHEIFIEMGTKYKTDIVCFWPFVVQNPIIMLNSYSAIRDAMLSPDTADALNGRAMEKRNAYINPTNNGILFSEGSLWIEQRRFAMNTLRNFGLGKVVLEDKIRDELRDLCSFFVKQHSKPVNPKVAIMRSVGNVICAVVFGQRMGGVDKEYDAAADAMTNDLVPSLSPLILFSANLIMKLPGDYFGLKKGIQAQRFVMAYLSKKISEHEQTLDPQNPRDFIDAFLIQKQIQKGKLSNSIDQSNYFTGALSN